MLRARRPFLYDRRGEGSRPPAGPASPLQDTTDLDVLEGTRIPNPESATEWPVRPRADEPNTLEALQAYLNNGLEAVSSGPDPRLPEWPPKKLDWMDRMSLQEYLVDQGASSAAIEILRLGYLDLWGEGIDSVSALMLFRDMAMMSVTPPEAEGAAGRAAGRQPGLGRRGTEHELSDAADAPQLVWEPIREWIGRRPR